MADIRAFRGFRYDLGRVGTLSDVVAPPYDVIDTTLQKALHDRSPCNAVRIELPHGEAADTETNNRYTRAASALNSWVTDGIIKQDTLRNLYICEQEFTVEETTFKRRGVLARVRLEPFGTGKIFPHEETMSGPKEDRLKLMRATGMNLSPIFALYPDELNEVFACVEPLLLKTLPLQATDHLGVTSRLWPITDEKTITNMTGLMAPRPLFIADGHHRYETALRYLDEQRAAGMVLNDEAPQNFILTMLVGMSDPGLVILPTHRLISGFPSLTAQQLRKVLEPHFLFEMIGRGETAAKEIWEFIEADGSQSVLGFHTLADNTWQLARLTATRLMAEHAPDHSADWRDLAVSVLHVLVIDRLLKEAVGGQAKCRYVHLLREVNEAIAANECPLVALVPPATMGHVERIAGHGEKMPPKSTYFYPKLLTGLVFNSLKVN
jgi:uncharacterized protein (DUF1015 family)